MRNVVKLRGGKTGAGQREGNLGPAGSTGKRVRHALFCSQDGCLRRRGAQHCHDGAGILHKLQAGQGNGVRQGNGEGALAVRSPPERQPFEASHCSPAARAPA